MDRLILNATEKRLLFRQDPNTKEDGGFQKLLVKLQSQYDSDSGTLKVYSKDLERIGRYAFKYGNGGWENRLVRIFGRHYGPNLGYL